MMMMTDTLAIRRWDRALLVGAVGLLAAAAWFAVWLFPGPLHAPVHHHHHAGGDGASGLFALLFIGGWTVMTVAMMLPTSLPLLTTFHTIAGPRRDRFLLVALVISGYLAVWTLVGLAVYAAGALIQQFVAASPWLAMRSGVGGAILLLLAGAYQFTPLKYRCLDRCRSPLSFVLGHWQGRHERRLALRFGMDHGLFCVGCCWALMLLMFAVGVGNLAWMFTLAAVMAVEKNVPWGRRLSAPVGVLLLAGGVMALGLA